MNAITYRLFSDTDSVSVFSHTSTFIDIETEPTTNFPNNISSNIPYQILEYYKKYYKKSFFPLQEAHMRYVTIIRNLREDADKTQQEIADFLGTSQTMYARYERGANEMPIHHLIKLAQYYNVSLDYLCGLSTVKRPYPIF